MTSRGFVVIAGITGFISWLALGIADFNALYKIELNLPPVPPDLTWGGFVQAHQREFWHSVNPATLAIFMLPAAALWSLHGHKKTQLALLFSIVILSVVDIVQLISFEGGDRKGCEGCYAWFILHVVLCGASVFLFISACALRGLRRLTQGGTDGP